MISFKELVLENLGIRLDDNQINMFDIYYRELIEHNKITNLTRIVDRDEVYLKHFFDSLTISKTIELKSGQMLCDLGTGAGFPGIPLKIVFPQIKMVLVDSLGKRITFLEKIVKILELDNVRIVKERAEEFAIKNQQKFDVVVSRAFSKLRIFLEIAIPTLKCDGKAIAMKGINYQEELTQSFGLLRILNSKLILEDGFSLPLAMGNRTNLIFAKNRHNRGYPRKYATIINNEVK